ncbi:hypothetical protein VTI74DRAFT_11674 [Chaetomium olivicolor]
MSRFKFFARGSDAPSSQGGDAASPYDDRTPLSPRIIPDDVEAQPTTAAAAASTAGGGGNEMTERQQSSLLHRFRPPIPSFFTTASRTSHQTDDDHHHQPRTQQFPYPTQSYAHLHPAQAPYGFLNIRPTSSNYSGQGIRGAPDTVLDLSLGTDVNQQNQPSPKSPDFHIGEQQLPGTRPDLPGLEQAWSQGERHEPVSPLSSEDEGEEGMRAGGSGGWVAAPQPAVVREGGGARRHGSGRSSGSRSSGSRAGSSGSGSEGRHRERKRRRRPRREGSRSSSRSGSGSERSRSGRSGRSGSNRSHRSHDVESRDERRARRERERRRRGDGSRSSRRERAARPKNFLFCFPWVKSRRMRSQILRCFVSGVFLTLMLAVCKC